MAARAHWRSAGEVTFAAITAVAGLQLWNVVWTYAVGNVHWVVLDTLVYPNQLPNTSPVVYWALRAVDFFTAVVCGGALGFIVGRFTESTWRASATTLIVLTAFGLVDWEQKAGSCCWVFTELVVWVYAAAIGIGFALGHRQATIHAG
jgi:hypothetical protein